MPLYDTGKVRFEGMVSTLKSGIVYADKITTVSPSHREELLSATLRKASMGCFSSAATISSGSSMASMSRSGIRKPTSSSSKNFDVEDA
jgi:glycogen synthase